MFCIGTLHQSDTSLNNIFLLEVYIPDSLPFPSCENYVSCSFSPFCQVINSVLTFVCFAICYGRPEKYWTTVNIYPFTFVIHSWLELALECYSEDKTESREPCFFFHFHQLDSRMLKLSSKCQLFRLLLYSLLLFSSKSAHFNFFVQITKSAMNKEAYTMLTMS